MKIIIAPTYESDTPAMFRNYPAVEVSVPGNDLDLNEMSELVRSALLACGWAPEQVDELVPSRQ